MTSQHHDTGYKELFSHPEFVQQLLQGFAPPEIARIMDFATLENHSGNYITPLFEEKFEDLVWSVEIHWADQRQKLYLYILLEFQSSIDRRMPIRLMHYVACFYDHLIKTGRVSPREGLPPILPIVLYNGNARWNAPEDIYDMITPEPPAFLRLYQPHLRYYLIDEGRYSEAELAQRPSPLSGVFSVENAGESWQELQAAVERVVSIVRANPDKERIDRILTRWIKRHLERLGSKTINLEALNSLVEDKSMLAENLENLVKKERLEGHEQGVLEGEQISSQKIAQKLIALGVLTDEQVAETTGLSVEAISALRATGRH